MAYSSMTTLTEFVPDEFLTKAVLMEARPLVVIEPLVFKDQMGTGQGVTYRRGQLPVSTAAALTEGTDLTATARDTTGREATVTVAAVGLSTDLTDLTAEHAMAGNTVGDWAASQGRAIAQKIDGDLAALFPSLNASTAVGTSGTDITVANYITAIYTLDANNAPGQKFCVLHPIQMSHLFQAIVASTGTPWANAQELVKSGNFFGGGNSGSMNGLQGTLFGPLVYGTTEVTNVNSNVDRCGAMFTRDAMIIAYGPRGLRTETQRDASARATEIVTTITYGVAVGQGTSTYGVPIETDDTV